MNFHVSLSDNGRRDVEGILAWLFERSAQGAAAWADRWDEVLDWLSMNAGFCVKAPESAHYETDIRQTIFKTRRGKPYRALFVIREDEVIVIHVRGPGQDLVSKGDLRIPDD